MNYFLFFLFLFLIINNNPYLSASSRVEKLVSSYYRLNQTKYKNIVDVYQRLTIEEFNKNLKHPLSKKEEYEFKKFKRVCKVFPKQTKENK